MRKVAFLVGNDTFPKDPSIPPLRFTQNDAREFAEVLEDRETCGFETRLYLNRSSQEVLTDLDQISGELGQDDTLLFYYSGHGKLRGNELCLVSNETTTTSLGATSIRTRLVLEYLQGSLARRRILILDCCHSGAIGRVYKAVDSKSTLDGLADSFGSYILTASTSIQLAEEREKDGHGVFTKVLIDCLREGPKERITINDLYEYAHSRLKISAQQTPLFWALQQEGTPVEIGNYQAMHEREHQLERERLERERQLERERLERERQLERERLITTARVRLGYYVALGELTEEQVEEAVALLKRDEARLFPRDRWHRDDLIRFSKGEASFLEVFGAGHILRPEPAPKPPGNEVSPPITPPEAPAVDAPLTQFEPPATDQPVTPPEPAVVDQFVTAPKPAVAEEPVLLSAPPVVYQPIAPPEPMEIDQTIARAELTDVHPPVPPEPPVLGPPVTPGEPEVLPGTGADGEPPEAKKSHIESRVYNRTAPSPTNGLFILLATLAIIALTLGFYFLTPGNWSAFLEDYGKQASLAVTQGHTGKEVTASPAEKEPSALGEVLGMQTNAPAPSVWAPAPAPSVWAPISAPSPVVAPPPAPELLRTLTLTGHTEQVWSVAFSPNGRTLASGSRDRTIKLWGVASGQLLRTLTDHTDYLLSIAFSPDGRTLASGSADKPFELWDSASGQLLRTLSGPTNEVRSVAFSPNGRTFASGNKDDTIKLWDSASGSLLRTLSGHTDFILSIAFSPDGRTLASGSLDDTIKLWGVASGKLLRTLTDLTSSVAFSPDGRTLASGSLDKTIKLWGVASGKLLRTLAGHTYNADALAFSPDGRTLASGSEDKTIKLWGVASGQLLRTLTGHTGDVRSVAFSPDKRTLASGSEDKTIKLWDVSNVTEASK